MAQLRSGTPANYLTTSPLQHLEYDYDAVGNVTIITDHNTGGTVQTQAFSYDSLDRLLSAAVTGGSGGLYSESYAYWPSGRMQNGPLGSGYAYNDAAHKHAVTAVGSNTFAYDANGNQTSRSVDGQSYSLTYNAENQLVSVSGGATASFLYDGDGVRVKGTVGGVTSYYPNRYYEVAGGVVKKYYYAGDTRIAMKDGGTNRTLLGDHLGSTAYTLSGTSKTGEVRYRAFGATRFTSGTTPTTYRYTGQREEVNFGLYYYGARWYDPALGRFVQADTLVPGPGDAQSYDRYAYVNNNPLKYTDPSGHCGMLAELGESFTSPFAEACMGMSAGAGLSRRAKAALSAGGGLTAAAALNAGLATGSPPSVAGDVPGSTVHADPLPVAASSSTSFPLADGGPQTSIPPSTGVYNNTLNVLADPLPGIDPTGHIYAASSGVALANTANGALHQLDRDLRRATIAAARGDDGTLVLAVYGNTRAHTEQAVAQLRAKGYNVLEASSIRTTDYHAERQLYAAGYTDIGISRQAGMCAECEAFFRDKPDVRITSYKPQH